MRRVPVVIAIIATACQVSNRSFAESPSPPPTEPPAEAASAVSLEPVLQGLEQPLALVYAPGDAAKRLFVVEKGGRIRIAREGKLDAAAFLDIADKVSNGSEQGLLGLAFHPRFAETRRFFINFTDKKGDTHVVELKAQSDDPDRADMASWRELLFIDQPYANHNGGDLVFGRDGKLYIGTGDGGSANDPHGNAQNRASLLGKMLRLDVDAEGKPKPEIIQIGLRNPWRYAFDRRTGDLYIADVGQNKWEEVDVVAAAEIVGRNFGWNIVEGMGHCVKGRTCKQEGLTAPVVEYGHDSGCSITGGFVYRGRLIPALDGQYFYADYCTGLLRSLRWTGGKVQGHWDWKKTLDPDGKLVSISSFGEDADGELYLLSLSGTVYKFVPRSAKAK